MNGIMYGIKDKGPFFSTVKELIKFVIELSESFGSLESYEDYLEEYCCERYGCS